jgi:hypothetical protein
VQERRSIEKTRYPHLQAPGKTSAKHVQTKKKESEAANVIQGRARAQKHIKKARRVQPNFAASTAASHTASQSKNEESGTELDRRIMCSLMMLDQVDTSLEI